MRLLQAVKADPDKILCSDIKTVQADNIDEFTDEQLSEVFEDFYMFSCSFVDKSKRDVANPISQCSIDYDCLKKFMDRVRKIPQGDANDRDDWLIERMSQLLMIIQSEVEKQLDASLEFIQTSIRCFIILLQFREMEDYNFHKIFENLVQMFNNCYDFLRRNEEFESENLAIDMVVACMNKEMMGSTVLKFQSYISIVIMEKIFEQEVMQWVIQVMDIFYEANQLKETEERINDSDFYNDALNNEVDLRK